MTEERISHLIVMFAHSVTGQNEAMKLHEIDKGNRLANQYHEAAKELISSEIGRRAFSELLKDERVDVRTMAAAYLIPWRTEESRSVLEQTSRGKGIVAFGAKMALERWQRDKEGIDIS